MPTYPPYHGSLDLYFFPYFKGHNFIWPWHKARTGPAEDETAQSKALGPEVWQIDPFTVLSRQKP